MAQGRKSMGVLEKQPRKLLFEKAELKEIKIGEINTAGRERKDYGDIRRFALAIEQQGQIHPIAVEKYKEPYQGYLYFLLGGGRRIKALQHLKRETVLARIYPHDLNAYEIRSIELYENLERKDLTAGEEVKMKSALHRLWEESYGGKKISKMKDASGHSIADTAKMLGESKATTRRDLELGSYVEEVPELAKMKTKSDIEKAIKKVKQNIKREEQLKEHEEEIKTQGSDPLEIYKKCYIVGDFFQEIPKVKSNTIDLVDLDIDYPMEIDNNILHTKAKQDKTFQIYKGITKEEYPKMMQKSLEESYRVLKEGGWCVIWFGPEYFQSIQDWARDIGFNTSWYTGKWRKGVGHTQNPYATLGHSYEQFFYFKKGTAQLIQPHLDEFNHPPTPPTEKLHPYEKPIPLMYEIIETLIHPGSRIIVPFAGSGKTLIAGFKYKCHCVGWDLSQEYKDKYVVKLLEEMK